MMKKTESMNWKNQTVLVTGATGLVGSWLVKRLLKESARVVALIRDTDPQSNLLRSGLLNSITVVNGSLEDGHSVERAINEHEVTAVFHLGAQTIVGVADRNPVPTFEANIRGTYLLLEACRQHRSLVQRVLIASSDKAYGPSTSLPYTEELPPLGRAPYEVSKSCTDLLSQCYAVSYNLPVVIARCGNIFGGGDLNWSRIVPGTIASFLRSERPVLRSNGKFLRDYVYVEDAVDAYVVMAERCHEPNVVGEAFNFGPNRPLSVLDLVAAIAKAMDVTDIEPSILDQAQHEIQDQYLDSSKAKNILNWEAKFGLEEGLRHTVDWYRSYFSKSAN
jgi:CDP-glucose 4,6-dehydratase